MRFWRKRKDDIENRLRAARPEPSSDLVQSIEGHVERHERRRVRGLTGRLAAVGALSAVMLAVLAGFGGLSYAAVSVGDGAARAAKIAKATIGLKAEKSRATAKPSAAARRNSSADGNGGTHTICHVPPGNPGNAQTLTLSEAGAQSHLRNHAGDYDGPCVPEPPECDDDPDDDQYCEDDDDDDDDDHGNGRGKHA